MAWQPGVSGNPKGRRAEKPFADALRMEIAKAGENHQQLRKIARKLLDMAEEGDMSAIKEVFDRVDGKVPQAVDVDQTVTHIAIDERQARIRELQQKAITTSYREVEEE